ncbi:hypothetical protein OUZ56_026186 [Daphnia magna]|uniref:Uncharacterized protein n=1 Tax=Daphnia magna TaxID=35525 RepID=A0ABQ9ZL29_9CRUS|nr:hypothetical protein OUZ56_026186 [Daphnia magna]
MELTASHGLWKNQPVVGRRTKPQLGLHETVSKGRDRHRYIPTELGTGTWAGGSKTQSDNEKMKMQNTEPWFLHYGYFPSQKKVIVVALVVVDGIVVDVVLVVVEGTVGLVV